MPIRLKFSTFITTKIANLASVCSLHSVIYTFLTMLKDKESLSPSSPEDKQEKIIQPNNRKNKNVMIPKLFNSFLNWTTFFSYLCSKLHKMKNFTLKNEVISSTHLYHNQLNISNLYHNSKNENQEKEWKYRDIRFTENNISD
uniref:Uncharacterized protein n=1 Tax=Prevotella sp. GTC17262 TaxID=3236797 RepID=A0AB33JJ18_9BACT